MPEKIPHTIDPYFLTPSPCKIRQFKAEIGLQKRKEWLKNRYLYTFRLGYYFIANGVKCKFIKVTRKGFNLLDTNRPIGKNRCILKQHLYWKGWGGKELPLKIDYVETMVPNKIKIKKAGQEVHNAYD